VTAHLDVIAVVWAALIVVILAAGWAAGRRFPPSMRALIEDNLTLTREKLRLKREVERLKVELATEQAYAAKLGSDAIERKLREDGLL
jgi:hypothetical protein